jgi:hypothetical protein
MRVEANCCNPVRDEPGILPGGHAAVVITTATEQKFARFFTSSFDVIIDRLPRLLRQLKPDWPTGLLLPHCGAIDRISARCHGQLGGDDLEMPVWRKRRLRVELGKTALSEKPKSDRRIALYSEGERALVTGSPSLVSQARLNAPNDFVVCLGEHRRISRAVVLRLKLAQHRKHDLSGLKSEIVDRPTDRHQCPGRHVVREAEQRFDLGYPPWLDISPNTLRGGHAAER